MCDWWKVLYGLLPLSLFIITCLGENICFSLFYCFNCGLSLTGSFYFIQWQWYLAPIFILIWKMLLELYDPIGIAGFLQYFFIINFIVWKLNTDSRQPYLFNGDQVLWPECGWQPVSLTDLITGASVKKVYRKATLCIHPDKVQQKGATLQQKYIAEKVFDLLKVFVSSSPYNYSFYMQQCLLPHKTLHLLLRFPFVCFRLFFL